MKFQYSRESHPRNNHYTLSCFVMVWYLPLLLELMLEPMLLIVIIITIMAELAVIMVYYELAKVVELAADPNSLDARHVALPRIVVVGPPDA